LCFGTIFLNKYVDSIVLDTLYFGVIVDGEYHNYKKEMDDKRNPTNVGFFHPNINQWKTI